MDYYVVDYSVDDDDADGDYEMVILDVFVVVVDIDDDGEDILGKKYNKKIFRFIFR